jgi:hypothetical protein
MSLKYFKLNEPDVSAEDFKTEILSVNLKNGHYYSLRDSAVPVWRLLMEGQDVGTIVKWLAPHYGIAPEALAEEIGLFVTAIETLELIVPRPESPASTPAQLPEWLAEIPPGYSKPLLETYTEVKDLLMLDPIHDVDVTGWPHESQSTPEKS